MNSWKQCTIGLVCHPALSPLECDEHLTSRRRIPTDTYPQRKGVCESLRYFLCLNCETTSCQTAVTSFSAIRADLCGPTHTYGAPPQRAHCLADEPETGRDEDGKRMSKRREEMKDRGGKLMGRRKGKQRRAHTHCDGLENSSTLRRSRFILKTVQVVANGKRRSVNEDYTKQTVWVTDMFSLLLPGLPRTYF